MIRSALLASAPGLGHAHSTRADGSVASAAPPAARAALVRAAGGDPLVLSSAGQVHGARAVVVEAPGCVPACDALVTRTRGLALLVLGADCPLVALHDAAAGVAAVVHSGWRGTLAQAAPAALRAMEGLGAAAARTRAAVFPGIGPCCFEVGVEVERSFAESFGPAASAWSRAGAGRGKRRLDLRAAIAWTLARAGVPPGAIDVLPGCTACGGELFSHRASGGAPERHGLCAVLLRGSDGISAAS